MKQSEILKQIDANRKRKGFLKIEEMLELSERGNIIFDPFSTLISIAVEIGKENVFYPNVVVQVMNNGLLSIGDGNVVYPNSLLLADKGKLKIGNNNQFGDGGFSAKANMPTADIEIADNGRFLNGAQILGISFLGSGSQILGPITVQNSHLEGGDDFTGADPDTRGAVLKGSGLARGITLEKGQVINGKGSFSIDNIELQRAYHK